MKPTSIILFGALAYLGIKIFAKSGTAGKLQFFVSKVSVRLSGITPIVDIILGIQNPTNETLRIGSIVGEMYLNGHYAANISGYQLTDIKGPGLSYFPISARLSLSGVVSEVLNLASLLSSGGLTSLYNQTLGFKGYVNAEGVTLPLSFNYKVL